MLLPMIKTHSKWEQFRIRNGDQQDGGATNWEMLSVVWTILALSENKSNTADTVHNFEVEMQFSTSWTDSLLFLFATSLTGRASWMRNIEAENID
ncbi:hypothetical protein F441_16681 [Phytophthora nicotianae CJ01A1]|uniref:Uncharacterized protein n=3 Tax=Phytophthora nicotianae TaxID=4792 RepID=W2PNQ5_PHYN3|nr:hypothetical protein PPTG_23908 [Phytophthora nicotianae INRA-310]ETK77349.1 hypothetical protein L915_16378 [Phytophthora nicotianae]ETM37230.1 hypothetical protein L914_16197 [Phytophthora nicotianae]ETN02623.1 hypothetical protein PPTG_23908 [Phytophthora nicotianae INRA-310]ETP06983.1 hypothetical protein F441_16681 [Phytophthora nicotianae CJ01A1]